VSGESGDDRAGRSDAVRRPTGPEAAPWTQRLYAAVLRLLPRDLLAEHGAETRADFARLVRGARSRNGASGVALVLATGLLDVIRRAPVEHLRSARSRRKARPPGSDGPRRGMGDTVRDFMNEMVQAARALSRRPGYTVIAVVTLGLGMGANVAIFTVVNSVLLRPLAYPDSDRIVQIRHHAPGLNLPELNNSPGLIELYREDARSLSVITATGVGQANLTGVDRPARIQIVVADPQFFEVFATRPVLGRAFEAGDVTRDAAPVAILLNDAWRSRFGGDPAVIGRIIQLDGESTEVVGVMPAGFSWPGPETELLVAEWLDTDQSFASFGTRGLARLSAGATLDEARTELRLMQSRLPEVWTGIDADFLDRAAWAVSVERLRDLTVQDIEQALWVLFGTVGLVLLIAAANVANLFLVRAESRQREVAVRVALGANRRRVAATFIAESLLLGGAGGVIGALLAAAGVSLLVASGPAGLPRLHEIGVNGVVLGFAAGLAIVTGVLLGLIPMPGRARQSMADVLREGGRTATAGRRRHRARRLLIVSQVAMAAVLLTGSGLMLRSVVRLGDVDPGFDSDDVLTVGVARGDASDHEAAARFYDAVLQAISAIPAVESAGAINGLPLDPVNLNGGSFHIESRPRAEGALPPTAMFSAITPGLFETLDIALLEGRYPERNDVLGGPLVVWVNQAFAKEQFPDGAIGERIRFGGDSTWATIAGVVGDVRTWGLRDDVGLMAYYPLSTPASVHLDVMNFAIRSDGAPGPLLASIRQAVAGVDPAVPLTASRTMNDVVAASMAALSFTMVLLAIAAVVALLLGAVGLYGVISWVVAQRTHELGVRLALGARPESVRGMVVRQGITVTLTGIAAGLLAALAATRLLASMLFGVSVYDPITFVAVPFVLLLVSLIAAWLPARRAAAADPLQAMRAE
jgi:putative ABC transport system permease protein